ncbi:hypothetical protein EV702DRAFT_1050356 [Suillus placidus]|uniref:Uncharacterized protein n=1 Tax=Suillus placidus TaxID=48579 RepID=A0A9P6ZJ23_9AGAM|nr:hypothetical protein EV702DRAFT_1050356 [Suillus placidus]
MARSTLDILDEVTMKQRVQEIIQYMQNTCPIISGGDSPVMDSTFVDWQRSKEKEDLSFFMKLCLICGLIATDKPAFASEGIDVKDQVCTGSPFSLDNFFSQCNGWLEFEKSVYSKGLSYHRRLRSIVFSDRIYQSSSLHRLAAGDWTAFPPMCSIPYNVSQPHCLRMWDSPPTEDPNPTEIETTPMMERSRRIRDGTC